MSHLPNAGAEAQSHFNLIPGLKAGAPTMRRKRHNRTLLIQDSNSQYGSSSRVPGLGVVCWVHGGHTEDGRMRLMILPRFGGDDRDGRSFYAVMARGLWASSLGLANDGDRVSGFTSGGCLFFEDGLFDGTEHEGGEMADGFGGAELELATAELVDGIGQQLG